ncbi:MAG TPA: putative peptidoglycan glycosyltransferase FtsW [Candidatus Saccharimonadales bacterium]|nr:putative peptidoglycan glycosyltransferase FtsW [Candidatus Saccharimonadales bacterium]
MAFRSKKRTPTPNLQFTSTRKSQRTPQSVGEGTVYLRRHRPDYIITLLMIVLVLLGIVVIYSVSPALAEGLSSIAGGKSTGININQVVYRQFGYVGLGIVAFLITAFIPLEFWSRIKNWLIGGSLIACLLLEVLPKGLTLSVNGATRWLNLGFVSFQPSELLKFSLVIFLASFLASRIKTNKVNDSRDTFWPLVLLFGVVALIVAIFQDDLGTMFPIMAIFLLMYFIAGVNRANLIKIFVGLGISSVALIALFPHRVARILTFLHSNTNVAGSGYQIHQALIAVGSGGLTGTGLGQGVQAFGYLPEASNDSIFAIVAEKFGFIGTVIVLILFAILFVRIIQVMERSSNEYMKLVVAGVFAWVFTHTVVNIGAMLSVLPLTGVTLPFISYGGTSLLFIMAAVGLVINASRYTDHQAAVTKEETGSEDSGLRRRFRGAHNPSPSGS